MAVFYLSAFFIGVLCKGVINYGVSCEKPVGM